MAWTVLHIEKLRFRFVNHAKKAPSHGQIVLHIKTSNIINLADAAALKDRQNPPAIVLDMQPIALLFSIPIYGEWLVVECVGDHKW